MRALNVLEACRHTPVENLIYASSSSVYGLNKKMPFSLTANVDHPVSLHAAVFLRSNKAGHFQIVTSLPNGSYRIEVDREGYEFDPILIEATGELINPIAIRAK